MTNELHGTFMDKFARQQPWNSQGFVYCMLLSSIASSTGPIVFRNKIMLGLLKVGTCQSFRKINESLLKSDSIFFAQASVGC
jgi:hypothetical protein